MGSLISLAFSIPITLSLLLLPKFYQIFNNEYIIKLLVKLKLRKSFCSAKRVGLHDPRRLDDLRKIGILPTKDEWKLESPSREENEDLTIFGVNSWGQSLLLVIKWRPKSENSAIAKCHLVLKDGKGNTFSMDEVQLVPTAKNGREYKARGLSVEVLCPYKRLRIKLRGYLRKNDSPNDLVFVRSRMIWLSTSNVFDSKCDHDSEFIEKEILERNCNLNQHAGNISVDFEDCLEQMGQFKGTIQFENEKQEEIFLWGSKRKRFNNKNELSSDMSIKRLIGYSKKGLSFHVGCVNDCNGGIHYRYGSAFCGKSFINSIQGLSKKLDFQNEISNNTGFTLDINKDKIFKIELLGTSGTVSDGEIIDIKIDGAEGKAIYLEENGFETIIESSKSELHFPYNKETDSLVLSLSDINAENECLSGGKGASLASLHILSQKNGETFTVPKGIVITTNAYLKMINSNDKIKNAIKNMQSLISKPFELKAECQNVVNLIQSTQLPQTIKESIKKSLLSIYTKEQLSSKLFAVRSSACGEDSEEMSAAGQMTTYLAVKDLDEIYSSVMKCWSSQFDYIAIEYKRGYGQEINSPMAVVVQEMVNADAAGVMFTCDPVSGDEREVVITANYGIGESVVAAMAEPDTIRLNVSVKDNNLENRDINGIKMIEIGTKVKSIKVKESLEGGTFEQENIDPTKCCLSDEDAIRIGRIGLKIQCFYGNVRDIEWGIKDGKIFMFQSRPITSLESTFTEFELMHECDTGLPSEREYISKANVGEVMPGCTSHLNQTYMMSLFMPVFYKNLNETEGLPLDFYNAYAPSDIMCAFSHVFFNMKNSELLRFNGENMSSYCKGMIMSIYGHQIEDPDFLEDIKDHNEVESLKTRFWKQFYLTPYMIFPKFYLEKYKKLVYSEKFINGMTFGNSNEMFEAISGKIHLIMNPCLYHIKLSEASSMYNHFLISLLTFASEDDPNVYTDFAYLMSQCDEVLSAEVPACLREISKAIEDPIEFVKMTDEDALQYLKSGKTNSSKKFLTFLKVHGHRGIKEFDPLVKPWKDDSIPVVKSLKTMLGGDPSLYEAHKKKTVNELMKALKTQLSLPRKLLIQYVVLPLARYAVGMRENAKSCLIYSVDISRQALWKLAERMHEEGRLPEVDLMFHLNMDEIEELTLYRNPVLVMKAKQRKALHYKMDKWHFDEICKGYNFKPRELLEDPYKDLKGEIRISGTPVSNGKKVARVCVAPNLEDAVNIKPGDILVTYSTDIGWSPYFPMISGIATEIGGLVSHGAVIAREYGIPCLVNVTGACSRLKTGDLVMLDCDNRVIMKIADTNQNEQFSNSVSNGHAKD